jgi:hypothetical protein
VLLQATTLHSSSHSSVQLQLMTTMMKVQHEQYIDNVLSLFFDGF